MNIVYKTQVASVLLLDINLANQWELWRPRDSQKIFGFEIAFKYHHKNQNKDILFGRLFATLTQIEKGMNFIPEGGSFIF